MNEMTDEAEPEQNETELDRLATLQEIDQRLRNAQLATSVLEQEIRAKEQELEAAREQVRSLLATRAALETRQRELEGQSEDEDAKMKDRRMRLNRVRTEKELQAVRREIELGKEANQQMETELIACLEQLEATTEALATAEAELSDIEAPATREIDEKRGRLTSLERDAAQDARLRAVLAEKLDGRVRSKYEQIFARRGGLAVVELRNGTCLGCHMNVPPQLFNEIQKTREVRLCPNCHRMLFWRPESAEAAESTR